MRHGVMCVCLLSACSSNGGGGGTTPDGSIDQTPPDGLPDDLGADGSLPDGPTADSPIGPDAMDVVEEPPPPTGLYFMPSTVDFGDITRPDGVPVMFTARKADRV